MSTELINAIKEEMGFREQINCDSCRNCEKYEENIDSPTKLFCTYAGKIRFEVDEDDWCNKWEEL